MRLNHMLYTHLTYIAALSTVIYDVTN